MSSASVRRSSANRIVKRSSKAKSRASKGRKTTIRTLDYTLLLSIMCLMVFGLIMLYSTSSYRASVDFGDSLYYIKRQLRGIILGIIGMTFLATVPYTVWKKFATFAHIVITLMCITVIFLGRSAGGQSRWFGTNSFGFQPSEIAKIVVILFIAKMISDNVYKMRNIKNSILLFLYVAPVTAAVAYTNLSTGIIIAGIAFVMIFVSHPKYMPFVLTGIALISAVIAIIAFNIGGGYRAERIQVWLNPESSEKGTQTLQGLYAIGSGGLFGKGLGESAQKLGSLPEAKNDMIFSVICEELGIFGAICIILLYIMLLWRLLVIASNARDLFGSYLVIGIMTHIALQIILHIAVVTNSMPNTGITLPFVSYGSSHTIMLYAELGIALSVSRKMRVDVSNIDDI